MADAHSEEKAKLEARIAKKKAAAAEERKKLRELEKRLKAMERPRGLTKAQQTTLESLYGQAVRAVLLGNPQYAETEKAIMSWLDKEVKSDYRRKLLGLAPLESSTPKEKAPTPTVLQGEPVRVPRRIALTTTYEEHKQLRELVPNAFFEGGEKKWYIPPNTDLRLVEKWLEKPIDEYKKVSVF